MSLKMKPMKGACDRGFTLVEIAITMVIIGFLIGGVLVGRNMINDAGLRQIISTADKYKVAIILFKGKYRHLPGDMPNAYRFWGAEAGCTDAVVVGGGSGCNGNGNGYTTWNDGEGPRAWQFLALSGMIAGSYTGIGGGTNYRETIGRVNAPISTHNNGNYWLSGDATHNIIVLNLGAHRVNSASYGRLFSTMDAWQIDKKMDDGIANLGEVVTLSGTGGNCRNGSNDYDLNRTGIECYIHFRVEYRTKGY